MGSPLLPVSNGSERHGTPQSDQSVQKIGLPVDSSPTGASPVVAGVMDTATDVCLAHARAARDAGVDGLVVTAPYYTRTNQTETIDHFRYLRDGTGLPLVAYDIPVCVNLKLARDTVHTLAREGLICALKDSSGDAQGVRQGV